jgi:hypothetical protein
MHLGCPSSLQVPCHCVFVTAFSIDRCSIARRDLLWKRPSSWLSVDPDQEVAPERLARLRVEGHRSVPPAIPDADTAKAHRAVSAVWQLDVGQAEMCDLQEPVNDLHR